MSSKADVLAALTILDTDGMPVSVGSLWATQSAVVGFVRHFG